MSNTETYDVVVVGSGAAGATAALRAKELGLSVLIVEKTNKFGGTSATSGGVMWVPNHDLAETGDSREEARARLVSGLVDFELLVEGGASNKGYLIDLLETDAFRRGAVDTEWLDLHPELRAGSGAHAAQALVAAAILSYQRARDGARAAFLTDPSHIGTSRIPASDGQRIDLSRGGESYRLGVYAIGAWRYRVHLDGRVVQASLRSEGGGRGLL